MACEGELERIPGTYENLAAQARKTLRKGSHDAPNVTQETRASGLRHLRAYSMPKGEDFVVALPPN